MNDSGTLPKETLSALRFMLPPLLTLILGKLLFELLAFHFPDLNDYLQDSIEPLGQQFPPEILFRESRARLLWLSSVIVYFIIYVFCAPDTVHGIIEVLANMEAVIHDIHRCQPWRAKRRLVVPSSREAALFSRRALRQRENKVGLRTRRPVIGRQVRSSNELAKLLRSAW